MKLTPICLILPALALAACNSGSRDGEQAAAAAAHAQNAADAAAVAAAVAQTTPDRLSSFVVQAGGAPLSFRRTGPSTWEGPSPDNGQVVQWSQEDADSSSLVLYTETPRIRTLVVYGDDTVSCSCFDGPAVIASASYQ